MPRFLLPPLAALALLAPVAGAASAEILALPEDRGAIEACLSASGIVPRGCIGTVAVVCSRQARNEGAREDIACAERETAVWRERLEKAVAAIDQQLEAGPAGRFAELRRLGDDYVAKKCAFSAEMASPFRAERVEAQCLLRETGLRVLEFERLLRRRGQAEPGPEIGPEAER